MLFASLGPLLLVVLLSNESLQINLRDIKPSKDLIKKILPLPTVPPQLSRTHRVGAQRYLQFGPRCWDMESCDNCVCCGSCSRDDFVCNSPPGSLDYCLLYEKISLHTELEKQDETISSTQSAFPVDFPDIGSP